MDPHFSLLDASRSVVVAIDFQTALVPALFDAPNSIGAASRLLHAARILDVPIVGTTQNAPKLGGFVDTIVAEIADAPVFDKMTFSAAGADGFLEALLTLRSDGRDQIVLCGAETHVCVLQTAVSLLARGYFVHVAADAVTSRTEIARASGLSRCRDAGALHVTVEGAIYEWLREAGTDTFRKILPLVK